jgi:hypothetical protein
MSKHLFDLYCCWFNPLYKLKNFSKSKRAIWLNFSNRLGTYHYCWICTDPRDKMFQNVRQKYINGDPWAPFYENELEESLEDEK